MFTGVIEGVGPRYCPSIEDKVSRFADRTSHQIFLEPEGLSTTEFYPNGISTSLPFDIQLAAVHSIAGLENAHIVRPGYAIEYDYFDPALKASFETQEIHGLFFAGQINGTTGYEEAAAQGLYAGINAARSARDEPAWLPRRDQAYLGVLVDDLVSKGVTEPYRMFTSRAEYRLHLREDNADVRLTPIGRELGLIDEARWKRFGKKQEAVASEAARLNRVRVGPSTSLAAAATRILGQPLERDYALVELLRRPGVSYDDVARADFVAHGEACVSRETLRAEMGRVAADAAFEQVEIEIKYPGYVDRQKAAVARSRVDDGVLLPADLDYDQVRALSFEARQVLKRRRPENLAKASRLSGVTPAAISVLKVYLKRRRQQGGEAPGTVKDAA
jgi:tRNA uridine 5-carboxymethylaminomethyl modification enzyme